ncbi:MAG: GNAT family N-acetyltransferase [Paenibacillaceae bacterium]
MDAIKLVTVEPTHADLAVLIRKLDAYLDEMYPADEVFKVDFDSPKVNHITFVLAYCDDVPVGCGAISPLGEGVTELKRFYVEPAYRRHGIAIQILNMLETKARESDYMTMKLETGDQQPEAINFYKKHGFREIDKYGEYVDCTSSVCYEKQL